MKPIMNNRITQENSSIQSCARGAWYIGRKPIKNASSLREISDARKRIAVDGTVKQIHERAADDIAFFVRIRCDHFSFVWRVVHSNPLNVSSFLSIRLIISLALIMYLERMSYLFYRWDAVIWLFAHENAIHQNICRKNIVYIHMRVIHVLLSCRSPQIIGEWFSVQRLFLYVR